MKHLSKNGFRLKKNLNTFFQTEIVHQKCTGEKLSLFLYYHRNW